MAAYTHFRVARPVRDIDAFSRASGEICRQILPDDYSNGIFMPTGNEPDEKRLVGEARYTVRNSLVLPIFELVKPIEWQEYRSAFHHAAKRYDDGSKTVDAQVTDKIRKIGFRYDVVDQSGVAICAKELQTLPCYDGFVTSLLVEQPDMFIEEHKAVQELMDYIARMKVYSKNNLEMTPPRPYLPAIPVVKYHDTVTLDEIKMVHGAIQAELDLYPSGVRFIASAVMPPKVY